jgi:glycosyltransferase involved in cell wall biosynthesis
MNAIAQNDHGVSSGWTPLGVCRRPLTIAFICDSLFVGGAERVLIDQICALDRSRFVPILFVIHGGSLPASLGGEDVRIFNVPSRIRLTREVVSGLHRIARSVRDVRPAVIHAQGQDAELLAGVVGRLLDVPVVATWHLDDTYRYRRRDASWVYRVKLALEDLVCRNCDRVVVISESLQRYAITVRGIEPHRLVLIPNAIRGYVRSRSKVEAKQALMNTPDAFVVGFLGRLAEQKNVVTLVGAIAAMAARNTNVWCVIVGDGPLRPKLQTEVDHRGIGDRVIFAGMQDNVLPFLEAFDVLALPSFAEGLPIAMLEAMSLGIPVIASGVGDVERVIRDSSAGIVLRLPAKYASSGRVAGDLLLPERAYDEMACELSDALEELRINPPLRAYMAERAIRWIAEQPSIHGNVRMVESMYLHLHEMRHGMFFRQTEGADLQ